MRNLLIARSVVRNVRQKAILIPTSGITKNMTGFDHYSCATAITFLYCFRVFFKDMFTQAKNVLTSVRFVEYALRIGNLEIKISTDLYMK